MLDVFSLIFVVDTKIIFCYDFVGPLRYGKNFDINAFYTDCFVSKKNKGNGVVIGNYEDYQKLPTNKKYLVSLMQTNNRLYIRRGAIFFSCLKEF